MASRLSVGVLVVALVAAALAGVAAPVGAAGPPAALAGGIQWLRGQQHDDGGFGAPASNGSASTDAALAFAAAGIDPAAVRRGSRSLLDYLLAVAPSYGQSPAGAAKLALAAVATGRDPRSFGGQDLPAVIRRSITADGQYGASLFEHGYAVLALAGAGEPVDPRALERIVRSQISDGAGGFAGPGQPGDGDSNTTALLVQALVAAGQTETPALTAALGYLRRSLVAGGGFTYAPGQEEPPAADANSTALAVQALLALNEAPGAPGWAGSLDRLARFQNASGALRWRDDQPDDNLLATVQALPALAELYLPFTPADASGARARRLAARPAAPGGSPPDRRYFPETGHWLAAGFKHFWEANGGLATFGYPLTEEFQEVNPADGQVYTVQYFERARFEYHPEHRGTPFEVQLGLLGRQVTAGRSDPPFTPVEAAPDAAACVFFPAVGHSVCGAARAFWEARGGTAIFGLPISQPFAEGGQQVQYFERARFELRGEAVGLGLLGREVLRPSLAPAA